MEPLAFRISAIVMTYQIEGVSNVITNSVASNGLSMSRERERERESRGRSWPERKMKGVPDVCDVLSTSSSFLGQFGSQVDCSVLRDRRVVIRDSCVLDERASSPARSHFV